MVDRVLVTGISGFIGSHVALRLLEKGYLVRGTVRNKDKAQAVVDRVLAASGTGAEIELVEADLRADAGWADAVKDCRYIQHIASPFPSDEPSDREALVPEARAGAQRVLEQGFSAGAERIVLTSSIAAMLGRPNIGTHNVFSEKDWSDPEWRALTAYPVSKTRAELSAWAYAKAQGLDKKLVTVNPGFVLGPDSFRNGGTSVNFIGALLTGKFPRVPKVSFPIIDVRDCASIHVGAMTAKDAGGRRLIAAGSTLWLKEIADILRAEFPNADQLPKGEVPNFMVKIAALFDDQARRAASRLGVFNQADAAYVSNMTNVLPRPAKESVIATARSLIDQGLTL